MKIKDTMGGCDSSSQTLKEESTFEDAYDRKKWRSFMMAPAIAATIAIRKKKNINIHYIYSAIFILFTWVFN